MEQRATHLSLRCRREVPPLILHATPLPEPNSLCSSLPPYLSLPSVLSSLATRTSYALSQRFPYSVHEFRWVSLPEPALSPLAEMAPANAAHDSGLDLDIRAREVPRLRRLRLGVSQIRPAAA